MGAKLGTIATTAVFLMACAPEGPAAIVVSSLLPDEECVVSADSTVLLKGVYDVSDGAGRACTSSYNMSVLVNSYLIKRGSPQGSPPPVRAEPNVLQITRAEVELLTAGDAVIPFGANLGNPFSVTTHATIPPAEFADPGAAVALIEVIPYAYKKVLLEDDRGARRETIIAAIKLFGTTTGGVDIELNEYRFPIQLCEGCLMICRTMANDILIEDLTEGTCNDNAGADGRLCVQSNCP